MTTQLRIGIHLELEFKVMGLNWEVCLLGLFAGTIARTLYMLCTVILVNLFGFPVLKFVFTSACIGRIREVPCWFDFSSRELVPLLDSIHPAEFWKNRSSTVSVITARVEHRSWNIGRYALSRKKNF